MIIWLFVSELDQTIVAGTFVFDLIGIYFCLHRANLRLSIILAIFSSYAIVVLALLIFGGIRDPVFIVLSASSDLVKTIMMTKVWSSELFLL